MTRWGLAATAVLCGTLALLAACGGGGDDDNGDGTATHASGSRTGTAASGTPGESGTSPSGGTPGAAGTTVAQNTPVPGTTAAAVATAQAASGETPGAASGATPGTGPIVEDAPTPNQAENDLASGEGIDPDQLGGDPSEPPRIVTDLPDPPDDASIDPVTIAPPNASASGIEYIIDTNASEPGIQSSRTIHVGDVIRVGVVLTNVPSDGLGAFNFQLNYDIRRAVAPTINGGSTLGRNPDINEAGLGGGAAQWVCFPAPEGDADEPGLFGGDGDPVTGQANISCYAAFPSQGGTVVLATVLFQAVSAGTFQLSLDETAAFDSTFSPLGSCAGGAAGSTVPCGTATITVN